MTAERERKRERESDDFMNKNEVILKSGIIGKLRSNRRRVLQSPGLIISLQNHSKNSSIMLNFSGNVH